MEELPACTYKRLFFQLYYLCTLKVDAYVVTCRVQSMHFVMHKQCSEFHFNMPAQCSTLCSSNIFFDIVSGNIVNLLTIKIARAVLILAVCTNITKDEPYPSRPCFCFACQWQVSLSTSVHIAHHSFGAWTHSLMLSISFITICSDNYAGTLHIYRGKFSLLEHIYLLIFQVNMSHM